MHRRGLLALLVCGLMATQVDAQTRTVGPAVVAELPPWHVPDIAALADDEHGRLVRHGFDLIRHTTALIGPDAPDASRRFSGNGLECTSCHLDAGTSRFALALIGIAGLYPRFSARVDAVQDLADRVNDCMERSMNGRPLPRDGRDMQALLAYLDFLASDTTPGQAPVGRGAPKLPLPPRAANPRHGAVVYQGFCAACHQPDGQGVMLSLGARLSERRRYLYPPLWGPESYNDAAGMARVITGAWFVHANMPRGITFSYPLLSVEDAYDVMAFVDTWPRPHKAGLARDYPDLWLKPIGTPYHPGPGRSARYKTGSGRGSPSSPGGGSTSLKPAQRGRRPPMISRRACTQWPSTKRGS